MASTEESRPQWFVSASAQQPGIVNPVGTGNGITTGLHIAVPQLTGAGCALPAVPDVPARATDPLPPAPKRPPLPPPARPRFESEALPPQAGTALAARAAQTHRRRRVRQDIERSVPCGRVGREPFRRRYTRRRSVG